MKKCFLLSIILYLFVPKGFAQDVTVESELNSLVKSERDFCKTSIVKGTKEAFLAYLADDAILFRPTPVPGKKWQQERPASSGLLTWEPIFADVSLAGDLGYTTGPWEFRQKGPDDKQVVYGNYVSIWKKQADSTWKVFIDLGISNPPPVVKSTSLQTSKINQKALGKVNIESERTTLLNVDREFSKASGANGIVNAYLSHINDEVRLFQPGKYPFVGKDSVRSAISRITGTLTWEPTAGDVARSGDLAYTYGIYELKGTGPGGKKDEKGNYVRIWKKIPGKTWQVVIDVANPLPAQVAYPEKYVWVQMISKTITEQGIESAVKQYYDLKNQTGKYEFSEGVLNQLGYQFLGNGKVKEAIEIFKLNVAEYPKSANTYDSLGEAYMVHGDRELAIQNYKKSLELNPQNTGAIEKLKELEKK